MCYATNLKTYLTPPLPASGVAEFIDQAILYLDAFRLIVVVPEIEGGRWQPVAPEPVSVGFWARLANWFRGGRE